MRRYEDFSGGDLYGSAVGRAVTETDNLHPREVVCEFFRAFLVPKRESAVDSFPSTDEPCRV